MKYAIIALMTLPFMTACDRGVFNAAAVPDVVQYSAAQQKAAADELLACGAPTVVEFMKDYCVMRDQARAARGGKPTCAVKR